VTSAWALAHINPEGEGVAGQCLKPLLAGLKLADPRARREAAQALGLLGAGAQGAIPELQQCQRDDDEAVREAATEALKQIGAQASR